MAAAPSFTPKALPAATVPPSLRDGVPSLPNASMLVARGCSSCSTTIGSPLPLRNPHGNDFLGKAPVRLGRRGAH
jgi:hypothetical protein